MTQKIGLWSFQIMNQPVNHLFYLKHIGKNGGFSKEENVKKA